MVLALARSRDRNRPGAGEPRPAATTRPSRRKRSCSRWRGCTGRAGATGTAARSGRPCSSQDGRAGNDRPFRTAFVRPDRLRFQFTDTGLGERSTILRRVDGRRPRCAPGGTAAGCPKRRKSAGALGVAAAPSGGSSTRVPGLLLHAPSAKGPSSSPPSDIQDGSDRGVSCYRIRGKGQKTPYTLTQGTQTLTVQDESITLWIDRATLPSAQGRGPEHVRRPTTRRASQPTRPSSTSRSRPSSSPSAPGRKTP